MWRGVNSVVEKLYAFIANSTKRHAAFVDTHKAMNPDQRVLELQRFSDTRWSCREDALKTIRKVFLAALKYLRDLREFDPPIWLQKRLKCCWTWVEEERYVVFNNITWTQNIIELKRYPSTALGQWGSGVTSQCPESSLPHRIFSQAPASVCPERYNISFLCNIPPSISALQGLFFVYLESL